MPRISTASWVRIITLEWKTIGVNEADGSLVSPTGSVGYRWGEQGKWNIKPLDGGRPALK